MVVSFPPNQPQKYANIIFQTSKKYFPNQFLKLDNKDAHHPLNPKHQENFTQQGMSILTIKQKMIHYYFPTTLVNATLIN